MVKRWLGSVNKTDDFGSIIGDIFIDGKTKYGPWAIMTPKSFEEHGVRVEWGYGQKYVKNDEGLWIQTEGGSEEQI
jgi:hypothetical protein